MPGFELEGLTVSTWKEHLLEYGKGRARAHWRLRKEYRSGGLWISLTLTRGQLVCWRSEWSASTKGYWPKEWTWQSFPTSSSKKDGHQLLSNTLDRWKIAKAPNNRQSICPVFYDIRELWEIHNWITDVLSFQKAEHPAHITPLACMYAC